MAFSMLYIFTYSLFCICYIKLRYLVHYTYLLMDDTCRSKKRCNNTKNILFYSILRNEGKNRALIECNYSTNKKCSKSLIAVTSYNRHNTITGSDPTYVLHHVFHTWIESEPVAFFLLLILIHIEVKR